jgi:hypothetical protein
MSNYNHIQFISWEIHTGGDNSYLDYKGIVSQNDNSDDRTDVLGQYVDIEARVAFTADAMSRAYAAADPSPDVLKVFMGPEFLYRGAGGAYLHEMLNGWYDAPDGFRLPNAYKAPWGGLFGGLKALAADQRFSDWVFVFGTAVSAYFDDEKIGPDTYVAKRGETATIFNTALIQRGGEHQSDTRVSRKHYLTSEDFVEASFGEVHSGETVVAADPESLVPLERVNDEGSALFQFQGVCDSSGAPILFGVEICIDHQQSDGCTAQHGRIRTADEYVRVQLVPSGSMSLCPESIRLLPKLGPTTKSYAFNCDGVIDLDNFAGTHTQIWNGANGAPVPEECKLIEASNGRPCDRSEVIVVATQVVTDSAGTVMASELWDNGAGIVGAGSVRIVERFPL